MKCKHCKEEVELTNLDRFPDGKKRKVCEYCGYCPKENKTYNELMKTEEQKRKEYLATLTPEKRAVFRLNEMAVRLGL